MIGTLSGAVNAFGSVRELARRRRSVELCELCSAELPPGHPHMVEPGQRKLLCACDACALLFSGRANPRFKRVPRSIRLLSDFRMTDAQWDGLMIPINMAFFSKNSVEERVVALYPSPAGATESLLELETWNDVVRENPILDAMESDVEALLVNRIGHARGAAPPEYYILPVDECFRLVGLIRARWHGLSGGTEVWQEIGQFFATIKTKARVVGASHA